VNGAQAATDGLWIDFFTGLHFRGELYRFYFRRFDEATTYSSRDLPNFRSIIIGPEALAHFARRGRSDPIWLTPGTILPDATQLKRPRGVLSLRVVTAS